MIFVYNMAFFIICKISIPQEVAIGSLSVAIFVGKAGKSFSLTIGMQMSV